MFIQNQCLKYYIYTDIFRYVSRGSYFCRDIMFFSVDHGIFKIIPILVRMF